MSCTEEEAAWLSSVSLLTNKPILFAANMSEDDFAGDVEQNRYLQQVKAIAEKEHAAVLPICAQIEADIAGMDLEEKELFLADMGLHESGLDRLINACYSLLGLISYLTAGKDECPRLDDYEGNESTPGGREDFTPILNVALFGPM